MHITNFSSIDTIYVFRSLFLNFKVTTIAYSFWDVWLNCACKELYDMHDLDIVLCQYFLNYTCSSIEYLEIDFGLLVSKRDIRIYYNLS